MKKYVIDITSTGITSVSGVTTLKRNTNVTKGILLNSTHLAISDWSSRVMPADYNDPDLYITGRQAVILPESEESNTIITNDGLVGVVYEYDSNYYISLLDLFDVGAISESSIQPEDYSALLVYTLGNNPEHVRTFSAFRASTSDYFKLSNERVYQADKIVEGDPVNFSYFRSERDYDLPTDEYGYYEVWTYLYQAETEEFNFFKKQFFVVTGPVGLEMYVYDGSSYVLKSPISGTNAYWFDTEISGASDLIRMKFKHSSGLTATIKIY